MRFARLTILLLLMTFLLFMLSQIFIYKHNESRDRAQTECQQIATLLKAGEFEVDSDYDCLFIRDGKLIRVKDW